MKRLTSADIMKQIKANKKKLAAIEELYTKNRYISLFILVFITISSIIICVCILLMIIIQRYRFNTYERTKR